VKIWDIEKGKDVLSVDAQHSDIIQSSEWSANGSQLVTTCKDKKLRIVDPRQNKIATEVEAHQGIKGARAIYLGVDKIFSCGFTKTSEREFAIWDSRNLATRLNSTIVDSASGLLMPFYDEDTKVLFLGGKGDGNIRYYEICDDATGIYFLTEYKSNLPQRGMSAVPKRAVNISENEIVKMLKVSTKMVEPISFQVPRKSDMFQDDIFPDCFAGEPALTGDEWLGGEDAQPKLRSLAPGFVQKKQSADFNPDKQAEPKELSQKELKEEHEKLVKRVAYLEAELIKKDAKIKEMSG